MSKWLRWFRFHHYLHLTRDGTDDAVAVKKASAFMGFWFWLASIRFKISGVEMWSDW